MFGIKSADLLDGRGSGEERERGFKNKKKKTIRFFFKKKIQQPSKVSQTSAIFQEHFFFISRVSNQSELSELCRESEPRGGVLSNWSGRAKPRGGGPAISSSTPLHSSSTSSWALSRCLARSGLSHQIHFISNQLQPLALMEGIKASSAPARLSRPTVAWTRRRRRWWTGGGMKGGMMERWRLPGGRDMKAQGGQPPQGLVGAVLFFFSFFPFPFLLPR